MDVPSSLCLKEGGEYLLTIFSLMPVQLLEYVSSSMILYSVDASKHCLVSLPSFFFTKLHLQFAEDRLVLLLVPYYFICFFS